MHPLWAYIIVLFLSRTTYLTSALPPFKNLWASAQVVAYYFPKLVDLHNYAAANAVRQKVYNWNTLNEKVCVAHGAMAACPTSI